MLNTEIKLEIDSATFYTILKVGVESAIGIKGNVTKFESRYNGLYGLTIVLGSGIADLTSGSEAPASKGDLEELF